MLYIGIDIGTATAGIAARGDDGEERVRVMPADFRAGGELSLQTAVKSADDIYEKLLCETIHDFDARTAADMADRSATVVLTCRGGLEKDPETAGKLMDTVRNAGARVGNGWTIDVLCVLPGAAASAVCHFVTSGVTRGSEETVLVVDFGDSAFRVSAVAVRPDLGYTVVSSRECADGCGKLRAIAGLLISEKLYEAHGITADTSMKSIRNACVSLMKNLNSHRTATVKIRHNYSVCPVTIMREEFTDKAVMTYDEQLEVIGTVFEEARDAGHSPDAVILTGGGMLLGAVTKRMCGYLSTLGLPKKKVFVPERPDGAEAFGAALIASEKRKCRRLGHCFGITVTPDRGGRLGVLTMLGAGTRLPAVSGELAVTGSAAQTVITVFRRTDRATTDISDTRDCTEVRRVAFGIPKDETAWISMLLGADGLVTVRARLRSGTCLTESFRTDYSC